jgi:hypothetical protein
LPYGKESQNVIYDSRKQFSRRSLVLLKEAKGFDMSGKSPAYAHRRKSCKKPAPGTGRGLFESAALNRNAGCRRATFLPPHFCSALPWGESKGIVMKRLLVAVVIVGSFLSYGANAQERAGSAALGAVSGAVVLGPVGAVAGAVIGYTAGPAIAHSWGAGRSASRARARPTAQASVSTEQQAAVRATPLPVAKPAEATAAGKSAPPVQGSTPPVQGFD